LGLFELESRRRFNENLLTLAVPMRRLEKIIDFMDDSFLLTKNWQRIMKRINRKKNSYLLY